MKELNKSWWRRLVGALLASVCGCGAVAALIAAFLAKGSAAVVVAPVLGAGSAFPPLPQVILPFTSEIGTARMGPGNARLYVTDTLHDTLSIIDVAQRRVLAVLRTGEDPLYVAFHPEQPQLYVANRGDHTVTVVDTATMTVINTIDVPDSPFAIVFDRTGGRAFVSSQGSDDLAVVDTATGTVAQTIDIGRATNMYVRSDGRALVVALTTAPPPVSPRENLPLEGDEIGVVLFDGGAPDATATVQPPVDVDSPALAVLPLTTTEGPDQEKFLVLAERSMRRFGWDGDMPEQEDLLDFAAGTANAKGLVADPETALAYVLHWDQDSGQLGEAPGQLTVVNVDPAATMAPPVFERDMGEAPNAAVISKVTNRLFVGMGLPDSDLTDGGYVQMVDINVSTYPDAGRIDLPHGERVQAAAINFDDVFVAVPASIYVYDHEGMPKGDIDPRGAGPTDLLFTDGRLFASFPGPQRVASFDLLGANHTSHEVEARPSDLAFRPGDVDAGQANRVYACISGVLDDPGRRLCVYDALTGVHQPTDDVDLFDEIDWLGPIVVASPPSGNLVHTGTVNDFIETTTSLRSSGIAEINGAVTPLVGFGGSRVVYHSDGTMFATLVYESLGTLNFQLVNDKGMLFRDPAPANEESSFAIGVQPVDLAFTGNESHLYAANYKSNDLSVFDVAALSQKQQSNGDLPGADLTLDLGQNRGPAALAAGPTGGTYAMYVANFDGNSVHGIGPIPAITGGTSVPVMREFQNTGNGPTDLVVIGGAGNERIYVANYFDGTVSVIDPNTTGDPIVAVIPVGLGPADLEPDQNGSQIFVANSISGEINIINTADNSVSPTVYTLP